MAIPFLTWRGAILKSGLPASTKHVLLTLGCHMNDLGESCFPSIELLCVETSLSNRVVILHLKNAKDAGWLIVDKHGFAGQKWSRNEYQIAWPESSINMLKGSDETSPPYSENEKKAVTLTTKGSDFKGKKAVTKRHTNSSKNSSSNSSSVESKSRPPEKITFDANNNKLTIPTTCYAAWENTFPKLDIDTELDKAELWLSANPKRRKKNYERFLVGWFSRAVENAKPRIFIKQQHAGPAR